MQRIMLPVQLAVAVKGDLDICQLYHVDLKYHRRYSLPIPCLPQWDLLLRGPEKGVEGRPVTSPPPPPCGLPPPEALAPPVTPAAPVLSHLFLLRLFCLYPITVLY
jgi:hypothetical protein